MCYVLITINLNVLNKQHAALYAQVQILISLCVRAYDYFDLKKYVKRKMQFETNLQKAYFT